MDQDRRHLLLKAQVAEQAERYDDMLCFMKGVAECSTELSLRERTLLSVAYKNVVGGHRASWRVLASKEQSEKARGAAHREKLVRDYKRKVETEIVDACEDVLGLIEHTLMPRASTGESRVFWWKLKGDYHRYCAEVTDAGGHRAACDRAYQTCLDLSGTDLPPTDPIRLGLALSYATWYTDILQDPVRGCSVAKKAFDDALAMLDSLDEEGYKESTLIMQLLRDNIVLWTQDMSYGDRTHFRG
jgi:14-3-3 protein epsilon